jgi:hypothetical protein
VRSKARDIPAAIGAEITGALPAGPIVDRWWRMVGILQGVLLGCMLVGFGWLVALLVIGVGKVDSGVPKLFSDPWLLPWPAVLVVVGLVGGWLSERVGTKAVVQAAERETDELLDDIYRRLTAVARELVVEPAERELAQLRLFRTELRVAGGN